ncbi:MAG: phosphonoacetaldehyde hydrolase [Caulobacterales bacterium]
MSYGVKAVIFDWAGTMVDFGCLAPVEALVAGFAAEGVPISPAEARADMGRPKRDHVWALLRHPRIADAWTAARAAPPGEADCDRLFGAIEPLLVSAAAQHCDLIPGAATLAQALRARGVRIGSCTGYTRAMMAGILQHAAAAGYAPDAVVCAGETPSGRPSPLMVWKALIELDAWPGGACVKVDDSEVGIEEGLAAGCWTIGVAASGNGVGLGLADYEALADADRRARVARAAAALRGAGAHFVVDTVADLLPVLDKISASILSGQTPA